MLRVVLDANVYLSYMAARDPKSKLVTAVEATLTNKNIDLLVPHGLIEEIQRIAETKEYFRSRIAPDDLERGIQYLLGSSFVLPESENTTFFSRDRADDYLIACALEHEADYLVTGDKDLLVLAIIGPVAIIPPAEYYWLLDAFNLLAPK